MCLPIPHWFQRQDRPGVWELHMAQANHKRSTKCRQTAPLDYKLTLPTSAPADEQPYPLYSPLCLQVASCIAARCPWLYGTYRYTPLPARGSRLHRLLPRCDKGEHSTPAIPDFARGLWPKSRSLSESEGRAHILDGKRLTCAYRKVIQKGTSCPSVRENAPSLSRLRQKALLRETPPQKTAFS